MVEEDFWHMNPRSKPQAGNTQYTMLPGVFGLPEQIPVSRKAAIPVSDNPVSESSGTCEPVLTTAGGSSYYGRGVKCGE